MSALRLCQLVMEPKEAGSASCARTHSNKKAVSTTLETHVYRFACWTAD